MILQLWHEKQTGGVTEREDGKLEESYFSIVEDQKRS